VIHGVRVLYILGVLNFKMNPYIFDSVECYESNESFEETKLFLHTISSINDDPDVFIKSDSSDWSTILTEYTNDPVDETLRLKIIPVSTWDSMTSRTKYPINSFGDNRLVRWKIGF
jgi:hypothetical protein